MAVSDRVIENVKLELKEMIKEITTNIEKQTFHRDVLRNLLLDLEKENK